jgi:hypothetical protein
MVAIVLGFAAEPNIGLAVSTAVALIMLGIVIHTGVQHCVGLIADNCL